MKENKKSVFEEDIDPGRFFELATTNRKYVNGLNLHEIKNEILEEYTGGFELIGSMMIGETEQKANISFKKVDDFETFINVIDNGVYDSQDVVFTGSFYKLNTPDFNKRKQNSIC